MAGRVPAIHVLFFAGLFRRGCPAETAFTPVFDGLWPGMTNCWISLMPRHQHRDHAAGPSQGQLRVGELIRHALAAPFLLSSTAIAKAEVCDKIAGDNWRPADGPGRTILDGDLAQAPLTGPLLLVGVLVALVVIPAASKRIQLSPRASFVTAFYGKWVAYIATAFVMLLAAMSLYIFAYPDDVLMAAVEEGCMTLTRDVKPVVAITVAVLLYGSAADRLRRFERAAEARYRGLAVP